MEFDEWVKTIPEVITADSLWKVTAYRYALYLSDLCWQDTKLLMKNRQTWSTADQLYRSVNSVGANIAEGYSRSTGRDRALFYQYALGSARESRDWYFKSRHLLGDEVFHQRAKILVEILRLLLTMIPQQRGRTLREETSSYQV